jgi:hypothetical protein
MFLQNIHVNEDELLWNKSAKYDIKSEKIFAIEDVAKNLAKQISDRSVDKSSYNYDGATVAKKHLLVVCDASISFYITHNSTHEFVETKSKGSKLLACEFVKYLNQMLADVDTPYDKIIISLKIPAVGNQKIPVFIETANKANTTIKFAGFNKKQDNDFTVVDITRNDYDPLKVGSFKVTIRLKNEK